MSSLSEKVGLTILVIFLWTAGALAVISGTKQANSPPEIVNLEVLTDVHKVTVILAGIDPEGDSIGYIVAWGDGKWDTLGCYRSGDTVRLTHTNPISGEYRLSVVAIDDKGASVQEADRSYFIEPPPLVPAGWHFGGQGNDCGNDVVETPDGGFVVVGATTSFGIGDTDVYLLKTDSTGNLLWQRTFGGDGDDIGKSIVLAADGGFVVVGHTRSFAGGTDVYLLKTDSTGNLLWQKRFGGNQDDYGNALLQTPDGGFIITGSTRSFGAMRSDVYLVRTDRSGNPIWQKNYGIVPGDTCELYNEYEEIPVKILVADSGIFVVTERAFWTNEWDEEGVWLNDVGNAIIPAPDNGYVIAGFTKPCPVSTEMEVPMMEDASEVLLLKVDENGYLLWKKVLGNMYGDERAIDLYSTKDGGYFIVGSAYGFVNSGFYCVKTDSVGKLLKDNRLMVCPRRAYYEDYNVGQDGVAWNSTASSVTLCPDGGFVVVGSRWWKHKGTSDIPVLKLDEHGVGVWEMSFGFPDGENQASSVEPTTDGGYIIVGRTSLSTRGDADVYLVKTDSNGFPVRVSSLFMAALCGPKVSHLGTVATFSASAFAPFDDSVALRFAWGDGDTSDWSPYVASGETVQMSHSWNALTFTKRTGIVAELRSPRVTIRAQAKTKNGLLSFWSEPKEILFSNTQPEPHISAPRRSPPGTTCPFSAWATDEDGDSVAIRFVWGDGDTSGWSRWLASGETLTLRHSWRKVGIYCVRLQAQDRLGETTDWLSHEIHIGNLPPYYPALSGPEFGPVDSNLAFSCSPGDPNDDKVACRFFWGDGDTSDWSEFSPSGFEVTMNHSWQTPGIYQVRVQVRDSVGAISDWSEGTEVKIYPSVKWCFETEEDEELGLSGLAIASDGTILYNRNSCLYALQPDGTLKWRHRRKGKLLLPPAIGHDGTIYLSAIGPSPTSEFYALSPQGKRRWCFRIKSLVLFSAIGPDGSIYFGSIDTVTLNHLYSLTPQGRLRWRYPVPDLVSFPPAVDSDGTIYFGTIDKAWLELAEHSFSESTKVVLGDAYFYALRPDGSLKWRHRCNGGVVSSPAIGADRTIYFSALDSFLYAFSPDGSLKWRYPITVPPFELVRSLVVGDDGTIYIGGENCLYALSQDGTLKWQCEIAGTPLSFTIIADGTLFVVTASGELYALSPDGRVKWCAPYDSNGLLAIGSDGTVYFGSNDGCLYGVQGSAPLADSPWPKFRHDNQNTGRFGAK